MDLSRLIDVTPSAVIYIIHYNAVQPVEQAERKGSAPNFGTIINVEKASSWEDIHDICPETRQRTAKRPARARYAAGECRNATHPGPEPIVNDHQAKR